MFQSTVFLFIFFDTTQCVSISNNCNELCSRALGGSNPRRGRTRRSIYTTGALSTSVLLVFCFLSFFSCFLSHVSPNRQDSPSGETFLRSTYSPSEEVRAPVQQLFSRTIVVSALCFGIIMTSASSFRFLHHPVGPRSTRCCILLRID